MAVRKLLRLCVLSLSLTPGLVQAQAPDFRFLPHLSVAHGGTTRMPAGERSETVTHFGVGGTVRPFRIGFGLRPEVGLQWARKSETEGGRLDLWYCLNVSYHLLNEGKQLVPMITGGRSWIIYNRNFSHANEKGWNAGVGLNWFHRRVAALLEVRYEVTQRSYGTMGRTKRYFVFRIGCALH